MVSPECSLILVLVRLHCLGVCNDKRVNFYNQQGISAVLYCSDRLLSSIWPPMIVDSAMQFAVDSYVSEGV